MIVKYGMWEVDTDSEILLMKTKHVVAHTEAEGYKQQPYTVIDLGVKDENLTGEIKYVTRMNVVFERKGVEVAIDAVLLDRNPVESVSVVRLGFGLPALSHNPQLPQTPDPDSPVGAKWPERSNKMYRVSSSYSDAAYPEGSIYEYKIDGRVEKLMRTRIQLEPGQGPFGIGGKFAPAWIIVG